MHLFIKFQPTRKLKLIHNDSSCGIGPNGFQPGNKCAKGGKGVRVGASKVSKTSKQKVADQKFEQLMATKTKSDQKAFRSARKDGIAIPPAWTQVVYHGKNADVRAEGRDAKGRKQRAEDPAYRARLSAANNARISKDLLPNMGKLRNTLGADAASGNEESKVLYLISKTGFRIGGKGDGKADKKAYGASNLLGEHVTVKGDTVEFDFPGKKGVRQQHVIKDKIIADMMTNAVPGRQVFSTSETKIRDKWKSVGGVKVHDIRHAIATENATNILSKKIPPIPKTKSSKAKLIKEVATMVSKVLGNNPSQTLNTYIDPQIWSPLS